MASTKVKLPGKKASQPDSVSPMLCTLTREPAEDADYLFEIKWDGYRIISYVNKGNVRMDSRSALNYTQKYPLVVEALKALKRDVVLDGEVVIFNKDGIPDFDALQLYNGHSAPITYCIFDVLWLDGSDLMELPLTERKKILQGLLGKNNVLRFSESFNDGVALYKMMLDRNLEGIVAKKKSSPYLPGVRNNFWLKTPTRKRQEFVIGGWAESQNGRAFRSLLFGAYEGKQLTWIGRSGGGYKEREMPAILQQLKAIETDESPFANRVLDTKGAVIHWVKPRLVANFEFATWTRTGRIRKPATFLGFRNDKKATQVVREVPVETHNEVGITPTTDAIPPENKKAAEKNTKKPSTKIKTSYGSNWPAVERQSREDERKFRIEGCVVELFNVEREIWKGVSKADLIQFYHHMAPYILTHIRNRPQSLHIKLSGAHAPGLYIKDMEGRQPGCADIFRDERRHQAAGKRNTIDYLVCNNEATLLWMINLGCIDINPWSSRTTSPLFPDYLIIDLDPTEEERSAGGLKRLLTTAMAAKEYFDSKKLKAFAKTSGKTGMHFLVPCSGFDFSAARNFAEMICDDIHQRVPSISTTNVSKSSRGNKIYIDPSQNDYADTISAPYCLRPYVRPIVATPLEWKEVNMKLDPDTFTMETIKKRLEKKGDLFASLYDYRTIAANNRILKTLNNQYESDHS